MPSSRAEVYVTYRDQSGDVVTPPVGASATLSTIGITMGPVGDAWPQINLAAVQFTQDGVSGRSLVQPLTFTVRRGRRTCRTASSTLRFLMPRRRRHRHLAGRSLSVIARRNFFRTAGHQQSGTFSVWVTRKSTQMARSSPVLRFLLPAFDPADEHHLPSSRPGADAGARDLGTGSIWLPKITTSISTRPDFVTRKT